MEFKLLLSNTPNPSSIAIKFGLGKFVILIKATRIAKEDMNRSIPDANSNGHLFPSYTVATLPSPASAFTYCKAFVSDANGNGSDGSPGPKI